MIMIYCVEIECDLLEKAGQFTCMLENARLDANYFLHKLKISTL